MGRGSEGKAKRQKKRVKRKEFGEKDFGEGRGWRGQTNDRPIGEQAKGV